MEPDQVDEGHDPLLLEDVIVKKPSALTEHERDTCRGRIHPKEGNDAVHVAAKLGRRTLELLADLRAASTR